MAQQFKKQLKEKSVDMSEWYNEVVLKSELADYAPVKGCMVIRPYGFALWEAVQEYMNPLIKAKGVKNAYFPLFIPMHFLQKEKEHVEGFAPELAVVTVGGGEKLAEDLAVRPTSETIMYEMYKNWTQSWRDLPVMMNQWCNVIRWEKRTYMFLRTTEFLWQEGHCAHLTQEENMDMVMWAMDMYKKTYKNLMAMYGVAGVKSNTEKFAGGSRSYTFEALMPNGKSLQACTSHDLGQNFSKSIDWYVQDESGQKVYPYQNSWGYSTRSIGGLILAHGDDNGLVLPPSIAPIQVIIVPLPGHNKALELATKLGDTLKSDYRVIVDSDDSQSAGFKFNKWEIKGVPVRLEIGNREAEAGKVTVFRRDSGIKETVPVDDLHRYIGQILDNMQRTLYESHKKFTQDNTHIVDSYEEFKKIMDTTRGFLSAHWCEESECEAAIKAETKATTRCLPLDALEEEGKCIRCGKPSHHRWLFGLSY